MNAAGQDRGLAGLALLVALASTAWFGSGVGRGGAASTAAPNAVGLAEAAYVPVALDAPAEATGRWSPPPAQRRGAGWVYEVFTPPEIVYDSGARRFTAGGAVARGAAVESAPAAAHFGLEVWVVGRAPYPLQLVGYAGEGDRLRGVFEQVATGETFLAGGGHAVPALGLTILRVEVWRRPVAWPDSMTVHQPVAMAMVRDERSGETRSLASDERAYSQAAIASVAPSDGAGEGRELREGETFETGQMSYRIEKIGLAPPTVEIVKRSAETGETERRTLAPVSSEAEATGPTEDF